jgi:hypothetical protein
MLAPVIGSMQAASNPTINPIASPANPMCAQRSKPDPKMTTIKMNVRMVSLVVQKTRETFMEKEFS